MKWTTKLVLITHPGGKKAELIFVFRLIFQRKYDKMSHKNYNHLPSFCKWNTHTFPVTACCFLSPCVFILSAGKIPLCFDFSIKYYLQYTLPISHVLMWHIVLFEGCHMVICQPNVPQKVFYSSRVIFNASCFFFKEIELFSHNLNIEKLDAGRFELWYQERIVC